MKAKKLKDPLKLFAVVCENGCIYESKSGIGAFTDYCDAENCREEAQNAGGVCDCKDHRIVCYSPIEESQ